LRAATDIRAGSFVKVEYLDPAAEGKPTFEIELRDAAGREWEFMCDARSGAIYEIEQEVDSAEHELFKRHAKVSEEQVRSAVLQLYPGEIEEVEYEIESDGQAVYELDVVDEAGTEFKIEVNAASGNIIEVSVEKWEIGEEVDERR
jgi:uncharacterized membrane protein YkoI